MNLKKISFLIVILLALISFYRYAQPLPSITAITTISLPHTSVAVSLPWPNYGQTAIGAQGYGLLATNGEQKPVPMASIAKVVTALAVLKQKPLSAGQQGPSITITNDDVAIYNSYYTQGGSVVKVESGEQLSEFQALQALLIPSANNIADTLVIWAFGSMDSYISYANKMAADLHLSSTKIADANGFSSGSLSSAKDLVMLGQAALSNQVLSEIVAQQSATLPVAGTVYNFNWLLGSDGVIGIKTGNTDQAGGCYLFASWRVVNGQSVTVIGAVMGAPDRDKAISDSRTLLRSLDANFEERTIATKGQTVGSLSAAWDESAEVVLAEDFKAIVWKGENIEVKTQLDNLIAPINSNTQVGAVRFSIGNKSFSQPVVAKNDLKAPPWHWRLLR